MPRVPPSAAQRNGRERTRNVSSQLCGTGRFGAGGCGSTGATGAASYLGQPDRRPASLKMGKHPGP